MEVACHATDGPPKIVPPGPSVAIYLAIDGPPDQVWLPWMVRADHLWRHGWSPLATDGPLSKIIQARS